MLRRSPKKRLTEDSFQNIFNEASRVLGFGERKEVVRLRKPEIEEGAQQN